MVNKIIKYIVSIIVVICIVITVNKIQNNNSKFIKIGTEYYNINNYCYITYLSSVDKMRLTNCNGDTITIDITKNEYDKIINKIK